MGWTEIVFRFIFRKSLIISFIRIGFYLFKNSSFADLSRCVSFTVRKDSDVSIFIFNFKIEIITFCIKLRPDSFHFVQYFNQNIGNIEILFISILRSKHSWIRNVVLWPSQEFVKKLNVWNTLKRVSKRNFKWSFMQRWQYPIHNGTLKRFDWSCMKYLLI